MSETGRRIEIEITPEMLAAGISALRSFNSDYDSDETGVARILNAVFQMSKTGTRLSIESS